MRNRENREKNVVQKLIFVLFAVLLLAGCAGDTDGGSAADDTGQDSAFVATDESVGSISISVRTDPIAVASTSNFSVNVRDNDGVGVPGLVIACDTEAGLAIIEPTTGREYTDSYGSISGIIGCEAPGSFQFACRAPVGGFRREFVTVHCQGDVPSGFTGFPGAAGGGLGTGGVSIPDDGGSPGGADPDDIRVLEAGVQTIFSGDSSTFQIDISQGVCGTGTDLTAEPFSDDLAVFTVKNNTNQTVRFTRMRYSVNNAAANGATFTSSAVSLVCEVKPGETTSSCEGIFMQANSGGKRFVGATSNVSTSAAVRSVKFTLFGTNESGDEIEISSTISLSFENINACEESS